MVHNERQPSSKQGGFMAVMFLILLGLFLTFAAFALDLGNYYLWRLRLDKAARAGASAGLGFRGIQGWNFASSANGTTAVQNAARLAVQDNLRAYGFDLADNNIAVAYNSTTDSISVSVSHTPSTIFVGKLDNIINFGFNSQKDAAGNSTPISASLDLTRTHQANLNRANVVLIIDVSGSMLCPTPDVDPSPNATPCSCRRSNSCGNVTTKLDRLILGVQRFAQHFNPNRDRIAVIPFNLAAQRLYSFRDGQPFGVTLNNTNNPTLTPTNVTASTFLTNFATLQTVLTSLAGSNTNHCDALAEGIFELEGLSVVDLGAENAANASTDRRNLQPFVVLFTDGAPNAMRGIFDSTVIPPGQCDTYNGVSRDPAGNCATNDFYHYALEWVVTESGLTKQYRGPGPFVERQVANNVPSLFNFPIAANLVAPIGSKTCGVEAASGNPLIFEQTITKTTNGGVGGRGHATNGCFSAGNTTFNFSIPYTNPNGNGNFTSNTYRASVSGVPISTANTFWRDRNWPLTLPAPPGVGYGLQKYDELPYYCAIEAADYIRTRFGGTIFTVGLGDANTHLAGGGQGTSCNDPLQDPDDHTSRKDFFLARLAFTRSMFTNQLQPDTVRSHYRLAGSQSSRTITGCSDHRLKGSDTSGNAAPAVQVGYTSADGLSDGATTYLDLRPLRPASMDTMLTNGSNGVRRIDTQGEYFPTDNANEIPRIFDLIAKTILLRSSS
jgi:hypothetical protein